MERKAKGHSPYRMKAADHGGPMMKNFPSAFKHRGYEPHTHDTDSNIDYSSGNIDTSSGGRRWNAATGSGGGGFTREGSEDHKEITVTSAGWGRSSDRRKMLSSIDRDKQAGYDLAQRQQINRFWDQNKFTT